VVDILIITADPAPNRGQKKPSNFFARDAIGVGAKKVLLTLPCFYLERIVVAQIHHDKPRIVALLVVGHHIYDIGV
jgi:hypothetical protein